MDVNQPLSLLAGMTPAKFMRRHWQKKPLLVRHAIADFKPLLSRTALFELASHDDVESRLIVHTQHDWIMKRGPFPVRGLPPLKQAAWTLLVQGVDLHDERVHALMQQFRFVPDARLDDLMISFATAGGGVGPHFDSYDVFLLQASGRRRWKISKQKDLTLQDGVPLKILQNFEADQEFVLEAGDMLYLPPRYAHDGIAEACTDASGRLADCMTYSVGFRAPAKTELAAELLHRLAEFGEEKGDDNAGKPGPQAAKTSLYRDADQPATATPAAIPQQLATFASQALVEALKDSLAVACALGEYMTEPKPSVWFEEATDEWDPLSRNLDVVLAPQTRMMYDAHHIFINGESYRARGADARLMHALADQRVLTSARLSKASDDALSLLGEWFESGWVRCRQSA